jgi:hypothetical protein
MAKKQPGAVLPKLTEAEQDLIWHRSNRNRNLIHEAEVCLSRRAK